jgi:hypothetical protein
MRSQRTAIAVIVSVLTVGVVACLTLDPGMTSIVAGFAGTALGILSQRHTSSELYKSAPQGQPGASALGGPLPQSGAPDDPP